VLLIATMSLDALGGALTMASFGLGTIPALLLGAFGAQRLVTLRNQRAARYVAGGVLLIGAALTFAGPWLVATLPWLHGMLPFECEVPAR
jgi:sulfite exporter TauE/SafE